EGGLDDALGRGGVGDAVAVGDGGAARSADLLDDLSRRAEIGVALAVGAAAEIVDHHLAAFARGKEGDVAADAAPGAGDDDDLAVEGSAHERCSLPADEAAPDDVLHHLDRAAGDARLPRVGPGAGDREFPHIAP